MDQEQEIFTEEELRAFVGERADTYLAKWTGGPNSSLNGAAFLFSTLWLGHRKLYKLCAVAVGILLVETFFEQWIFLHVLGREEVPPTMTLAIALGVGGACGYLGNQWYWTKATRTILEVRALGLPENEKLQELAQRGGTSLPGTFLVPLTTLALVFVVLSILELLGFSFP